MLESAGDLSCSSWDEGPLQFDAEKFQCIIHYVCWTCEDPRVLNFAKLNRVLWYFERNACLTAKRPVTGATFARTTEGAVALPTAAALRRLVHQRRIVERNASVDPDRGRYFAVHEPDLSGIRPQHVANLEAIIRAVCFGSDTTIPNQSGIDRVLELIRFGEQVPYFTVFAGFDAALSAADVDWAVRESSAAAHNGVRSGVESEWRNEPLANLALRAAVWRLRREPDIGVSLPLSGSSHFVYRQAGHRFDLPDLSIAYTMSLDQLIVLGSRSIERPQRDHDHLIGAFDVDRHLANQ